MSYNLFGRSVMKFCPRCIDNGSSVALDARTVHTEEIEEYDTNSFRKYQLKERATSRTTILATLTAKILEMSVAKKSYIFLKTH